MLSDPQVTLTIGDTEIILNITTGRMSLKEATLIVMSKKSSRCALYDLNKTRLSSWAIIFSNSSSTWGFLSLIESNPNPQQANVSEDFKIRVAF